MAHNLTIIYLLPREGKGTAASWELSAIRIRDDRQAGCFHALCRPDHPSGKTVLSQFFAFLGSDIIAAFDGAPTADALRHLARLLGTPPFAGITLDVRPVVEEAFPSFAGQTLPAIGAALGKPLHPADALNGCRLVCCLYKKAAQKLYRYQEDYPLWLRSLPKEEERYMAEHLSGRARRPKTAYFFWLFGLHYAYLRKPFLNLIYLLTLGGGGFWFLLDLFRMPYLVDRCNEKKALAVKRTMDHFLPQRHKS